MKICVKIASALLAVCLCATSSVSVFADGITADKKENIIVINGVEYDTTGMSEAEIDALKQQNVSTWDIDTGDMSLNDKLNPSYSIDSFFKRGWSDEFAKEKTDGTQGTAGEAVSDYESALELVVNLGVMSKSKGKYLPGGKFGYDDFKSVIEFLNGYFEQPVSLEDADSDAVSVEMLASALAAGLGYKNASVTQFQRTCADIKSAISKEELSTELLRDVAAKMIYNAMDYPMVTPYNITKNSAGSFDSGYKRDKQETILKRMEIYLVTGWVNATDEINIYGGNVADSADGIQIERQDYVIPTEKYKSFIGRYVDAFVTGGGGNGQKVVSMTVNPDEDKNLHIIAGEDICASAENSISYYIDGKKKTVKVSDAARVIVNATYSGSIKDKYSTLSDCDTVQLIDSNLDGKFDVVVAVSPDIYYVNSAKDGKVIVNDYSKVLDFSDYDSVSVIKNGVYDSVDNIPEGSIISVIDNKPQLSAIVYVGTQSDEGFVKEIDAEGNVYFEGIDEPYKLHRRCTDSIIPGEYYIAYLDYRGFVCRIEESGGGGVAATGRKYAYLRATGVSDGLQKTATFRMWLIGKTEGEWVTLEGADKMVFCNGREIPDDGNKGYTVPRETLKAVDVANHPEVKDKPQLVVYDTDSEGKLSKLVLYRDASYNRTIDENIFSLNEKIDKVGMYWQGMFASGKYAWDSSSIGISVPYDRSREKLYSYLTFKQAEWSNCEVYDAMNDRSLGGIVIRYDPSDAAKEFSSAAKMCLVKDIRITNRDDVEVIKIIAADDKEYYITNIGEQIGLHSEVLTKYQGLADVVFPKDIKAGDWLKVELNARDEITLFEVFARLSELEGKEYFNVRTDTWVENTDPFTYCLKYGRIVLNGKSETTSLVNYTGDGQSSDKDVLMYTGSAYKMYDYHKKDNTFTVLNPRSLTTDDVFIQYSEFWYINSLLVRIVD